jgi:hypothetical protein
VTDSLRRETQTPRQEDGSAPRRERNAPTNKTPNAKTPNAKPPKAKRIDVTILLLPTPLSAWRRGDGSDASIIYEAFARGVRLHRGIAERAMLVLRILFVWPLVTAAIASSTPSRSTRTAQTSSCPRRRP